MKNIKSILAVFCLLNIGLPAAAASYSWTDWTSKASNVVHGAIHFGSTAVDATFTGTYSGALLSSTDTNYFECGATCDKSYDSAINGPASPDLIQFNGASTTAYSRTITFSKPVLDPIMALVSVGSSGAPVDYVFNAPFTILSQGGNRWGTGTLSIPVPDTLRGKEGNGVIQFQGTYSTISWSNPQAENWHGITIGALAPVPEPETYAMLLAGLGLMGFVAYRRKQNS